MAKYDDRNMNILIPYTVLMKTDDAHLRYFDLWLCVPIPPPPNDLVDVVFRAVTVGGWLEDGFGLLRFLFFSSIVSSKLSTE